MAVDKYLADISGVTTEVEFTTSSAGAGDAGKGVGLNVEGKIDASMMPTGVGPNSRAVTAFEDITEGMYVNFFLHGGILKMRKADASDPEKSARAFVKADVVANATGTAYFIGNVNNKLSALTIGVQYYLSPDVPGTITADPSTVTSGGIIQPLCQALSETEAIFDNTSYRLVA